jgi:hypothetical protein
MTGRRRPVLTGISLGAAAAVFSLAVMLNAAGAMPTTAATVHAAQTGLSQVEKTQAVVVGPRRPGWRRRRVCFWRAGRRICTWR